MPVTGPELAKFYHERAKKAAAVRNSPEGYIRVLERKYAELTPGQKRRLAALLDRPAGGAEAGDAA